MECFGVLKVLSGLDFEDSEFVFGTFVVFVFLGVVVVAKFFVFGSVVGVAAGVGVAVAVGSLVIFATVVIVGDAKMDPLGLLVVVGVCWAD